MIRIALKSEFSFKKCFMHKSEINDYLIGNAIGIADIENSFIHPYLEKYAKDNDYKALFAVRLNCVEDATVKVKPRGQFGVEFVFVAKNQSGLTEINNLVKVSVDNFYYRANISYTDVNNLSSNVVVISTEEIDCRYDYIGVTLNNLYRYKDRSDIVYIDDNFYPTKEDKKVYECFAAPRFENRTVPQHILTVEEIEYYFPKKAIDNTVVIANMCEETSMKISDPIRYDGSDNLVDWVQNGAIERGIDLSKEPYRSRIKEEVELIESKDYTDYFLVTADLIRWAKTKMFVGPGRGSSGGSLVAYLMGIVDVDPIEYGLLFSRFLDPNRFDAPDIDTDFNDKLRGRAIKYLEKKYGKDKVKHVSNVSKMKPKVSITEFAKSLGIPSFEADIVKDAIIERSSGDQRFGESLLDTFEGTKAGLAFIEEYPEMKATARIEGHARHTSVHAAGVIVCNDVLTNYVSTGTTSANIKGDRAAVIQFDKYETDKKGLLKIDMLGLRTLTILQDTAELAGFSRDDYKKLKLNDEKVFAIFNDMRLSGIFQFEGDALQFVTGKMGVNSFDDICAITALARPGSMNSGGTDRYIKVKTGEKEPEYVNDLHEQTTKDTYGVVIYQETFMKILKEIAKFDWATVTRIRRISSKSMGEHAMKEFEVQFVKGCMESGATEEQSAHLWNDIAYVGQWIFNKSHAVAYSMISYYTAWAKAYHPLEFTAANLNNAKSPESALKILRDAVKYDGIDYKYFDSNSSVDKWIVKDGALIGSLTDIHGVAVGTARKIIAAREGRAKWTPSLMKRMISPVTEFAILYPCEYHWGGLKENFNAYGLPEPVTNIENIGDKGIIYIIGKLIDLDLRDINDAEAVARRDGRVINGPNMYLNFKIEDDTALMFCVIDRHFYKYFGEKVLNGELNKTWYLIKAEISVNLGWKRIYVKDISNLNIDVGLKDYDEQLAIENRTVGNRRTENAEVIKI